MKSPPSDAVVVCGVVAGANACSVGLFDGDNVGEVVGDIVGDWEGDVDGDVVGDTVGLLVG